MSDDDWDNDEPVVALSAKIAPQVALAANASSWDDEDADSSNAANIQDDWDAEDDDTPSSTGAVSAAKPKAAASTATAAPKKKKGLQAAIAARKAEEERKLLEALERKKSEEAAETPEERKRREDQSIREADLQNARDLFAGASDDSDLKPSKGVLETMKPKSKEEFAEYGKKLVDHISKHEKSSGFSMFVENLTRDLCVSLSVDEVKRIASALTVLANEKQKAQKPVGGAAKKKAVGKGVVGVAKANSGVDMTNYAEVDYNDYDDFM
ncbi:Eukaryotic translation initiation factor 3 subunit J [Entophlyctis luteolus]|nr:Eukaryotic translation initiation factor 3 subunit J [Entophlyctis luteolus]KAJ3350742.1 Eukaryotic translation initiation factor 3 subunit J [Entophlyctis luteolus]KAJ3382680.1 Eukaryotic translation initiation factor 3 subunit J [Entophlyctis sp. JEL0112]